jgi:predicted nucleic acid-binding protein
MKVLVDTNVVLDVLLNRSPFYANSRAVFELGEQKRITGYISASSITDIFYTETTITDALALRWKDFEDAIQFTVAKENDIAYIITRNETDFETSYIPCMSPSDFIIQRASSKEQ